ncbi:hypothetical protein AMTRI_Chr11g151960 [Amborella trichopoda]
MTRISQHEATQKEPTIADLKAEVNTVKIELSQLKTRIQILELHNNTSEVHTEEDIVEFNHLLKSYHPNDYLDQMTYGESSSNRHSVNIINRVITQKWFVLITIVINDEFEFQSLALIDSGADLNCLNEGLVPTKYFDKTTQILNTADSSRLFIKYKLSNAKICTEGHCFPTPFIMVKGLSQAVILGVHFLTLLYPVTVSHTGLETNTHGTPIKFEFIDKPKIKEINTVKQNMKNKENFLGSLQLEIKHKLTREKLQSLEIIQKIQNLKSFIEKEICSELPNAFWHRRQHIVGLPYEPSFSETKIPTKARPIQMNTELLQTCQIEINNLLQKKLIRPSSSPWSCFAFYVNKNTEQERGVPRLVINYKPLNKVLKWIRYPIPNKKDLLDRLLHAVIFSKFDLKSGFWQIQIEEKDKYKTAFNVPFGQYE